MVVLILWRGDAIIERAELGRNGGGICIVIRREQHVMMRRRRRRGFARGGGTRRSNRGLDLADEAVLAVEPNLLGVARLGDLVATSGVYGERVLGPLARLQRLARLGLKEQPQQV